jgi:hypothetical protein
VRSCLLVSGFKFQVSSLDGVLSALAGEMFPQRRQVTKRIKMR